MARSREQLDQVLRSIPGVAKAYFQPPTSGMEYPCIVYERDDSYTRHADNLLYLFHKRYTVTVIDRNPDSLIPDLVEGLPHSRFDRQFKTNGLYHTVFQLFF